MTWARKRVVSIVEGLGEEWAVPRIVERWIRQHRLLHGYVADEPAVCAKGVGKLNCAPGHQRGVEYFVRVALARDPHAILIVFDADKECQQRASMRQDPLGVEIFKRARASAPPDVQIAVVVADREFEAWFVEHRHAIGLPKPDAWAGVAAIEAIADCKKIVGRMLARRYDPRGRPADAGDEAPVALRSLRGAGSLWALVPKAHRVTRAADASGSRDHGGGAAVWHRVVRCRRADLGRP